MRRARAPLAFVTTVGATLLASEARAEPYVVAVPEAWIVVPSGAHDATVGGAVSAIGGIGLDYDPLLVGPQLAITGAVFPDAGPQPDLDFVGDPAGGGGDPFAMFRVTGGLSVGVAGPVEVSLYLRAGVALASAFDSGAGSTGVALDTGLSGDYRVSRDVTVGGQLGYAGMFVTSSQGEGIHALTLGPRFGYWF